MPIDAPQSPATDGVPLSAAAPVVALIGPSECPQAVVDGLAAAGIRPVVLPTLHPSTDQVRLGVQIAVLACDALVLVMPAPVGLDPGSAQVWRTAAEHGMPRAVIASDLSPETADLEDLAAIVARALEEEPLVPRLPVLTDDESVAASMDLVALAIDTPSGPGVVEAEHLAVARQARENLVSLVAVTSSDDVFVEQAMAGMQPTTERLAAGLAESVAAGHAVPVLPLSPDESALADLARWWRGLPFVADRLVPVDAHGDPVPTGATLLAVVLEFDDPVSLVRVLRADPPRELVESGATPPVSGPVLLTRAGTSPDGPHGQRSWPTWMVADSLEVEPGDVVAVTLPLRSEPGEALCVAAAPVWLLP